MSTKRQNSKGNNEESDINVLLYSPLIEKLFLENDICFLKFVLVDRLGLNLRNNIAHSLNTDVYNWDNMILVFVSILILLFKIKN